MVLKAMLSVHSIHSPLTRLSILPIFQWLLLAFTGEINARKLPDIHWNSSNPIFDISNTDHVKAVRLLDRVTILCPQPVPESGNRSPNNSSYEYSKLYMVSREGYDACELQDEKQLGVCSTPERQSSISLVFRDFSPLPSALEFQPGRSYYVIGELEHLAHLIILLIFSNL